MATQVGGKRRVVFLAHCLLNQNAKVDEFAWYPGVVKPAIDLLREFGYELAQLPCPEMTFLGVNRWWQTKNQYATADSSPNPWRIRSNPI
ncbi:MAG: hypothetical protein QN159_08415 [Armatimonadota bacterium]|nr:hypothetical protein [Armatimonadota bacterium]